jgi:DNA-binding response OmpR family regulator
VLAVDDDRLLRMSIQIFLEEQGYEVDAAPDVSGAIDLLDRGRYELVLTDLRLPDGDGLDVVRHARRVDPEARVILMTASLENVDEERVLQAGADEVFHKLRGLSELVEETRKLGRSISSRTRDLPVSD